MIEERFMVEAIKLARRGWGKTHPNPSVGAVIVKNGKIIGRGYHKRVGLEHAEIMAIRNATESVKGADLYVTLEPCQIYGRTPPCTNTIIKEGIRRVICGTIDPNPKVNGKGIVELKKNGVDVVDSFLKDRCVGVDKPYHTFFLKKRPYVHLKWAQTIDGITCLNEGGYISGENGLRVVHKERFYSDAIMVTSGTILRDKPLLTIRYYFKKKPLLRVIIDRHNLKDLPSNLLHSAKNLGGILIIKPIEFKDKTEIDKENVTVHYVDCQNNYKDLFVESLKFLREKMVISLYVESVGGLATTIVEENLSDKISVEVSPKLVGRNFSPFPINNSLKNPVDFTRGSIKRVSNSLFFSVDLEGRCLQG